MAHRLSRRLLARSVGEQLLSGASQKAVAERLAGYLVESGRQKEADLLVDDVVTYLADHGVVLATATSAFGLNEATQQSLRQLIERQTGATQIDLETVVDPRVLGGVKLALPGRELDTTIARKLSQLQSK